MNANRRQDNDPINRLRKPSSSPLRIYLVHHLWVAMSTLGQLCRSPFSTALTSSVIAISLALPVGLFVLLTSLNQLTQHWETSNQISIFLKFQTPESNVLALKTTLSQWKEIQSVSYISPNQALKEFKDYAGIGDVLAQMDENPLPPVLTVIPKSTMTQKPALDALIKKIQQMATVELVQIDLAWLQRLDALVNIGQRAVVLLASLLAVAVLLIIGNTMRLTIFNRKKEILVTKLIGATGRFIRRPFLYIGFWYGLFGAVLAWILVTGLLLSLHGPVTELALLYHSQFEIGSMDGQTTLVLVGSSVFLGIFGAWLAVIRHLKAIEPQ